jgi:hypothetical protein
MICKKNLGFTDVKEYNMITGVVSKFHF